MLIRNLFSEIEESVFDPKVNIKIAELSGDETMTLYATTLAPKSAVTAHAHQRGIELYYILQGEGEIYSGELLQDGEVKWNEPQKVKSGDSFAVNPGVVHQLKNISDSADLTLIFACPHSHLKADRIVTKSYLK